VGGHLLISNFTANIALPGSGSMNLHSDQALVIPPPWEHSWAANVIWCLDDIDEENGATRYLPGSHLYRNFADLPEDAGGKDAAVRGAGGILHPDGGTRLAHLGRERQQGPTAADALRLLLG
jgi:hypothetical protein